MINTSNIHHTADFLVEDAIDEAKEELFVRSPSKMQIVIEDQEIEVPGEWSVVTLGDVLKRRFPNHFLALRPYSRRLT